MRTSTWSLMLSLAFLPVAVNAQRAGLEELYAQGPHVGPVEQAVVGIQVTNIASDDSFRQIRHGCGVMLRCDGFVLAPSALFDDTLTVAGATETAGKQSVVITLYPGTEREQRVAGRRPHYINRAIGYAVLKMEDVHIPALQTLLPDSLKPDDALQVVWTAWDSAARRFQTPERRTASMGPLPVKSQGSGSEEDRPGFAPFKEPLTDIPAGAIVTGPQGLGVGLVTGTGVIEKCEGFTSFAVLDRVTNCVTPQSALPPSPPSANEKGTGEESAPTADTPMVSVPGGPVAMPSAVLAEQPDMEGASIACVAPFQIDKYEVTNAQYLAFWESLPAEDRRKLSFLNNYYPFGWARNGPPFPSELANLPVLGVPLPGARVYAKAHGKRLPTPYEWCLAALGPKGERQMPQWAQQYISERRRVWERVRDAHIAFAQDHPEVRQANVFLSSPFLLPWIARTALFNYASTWSKQVVEQATDPLWAMWRDPLYILPVGSRDFDVSPYGAADMIMNATELVAPYPGSPVRGADRFMEVAWLPVPPRQSDPWMPRRTEALLDNEGRLPPLSRLHRRALIGPTMEDILMWSNLNEATAILGPLAGWQVRMGTGRETSATTWGRGANPYEKLGLPSGYTLWREMPHHYRLEMGRPIPFTAPDAHVRPGPQLFYILPVGFRCAR
jgi:formylglycine-generating enzyme required for sulfatase activity